MKNVGETIIKIRSIELFNKEKYDLFITFGRPLILNTFLTSSLVAMNCRHWNIIELNVKCIVK